MAIVQLRSTNPQFSFLIKKNPSSGMQLRSVRKGVAYGWYTDESAYNVYFKDADGEVSYKRDAGEKFEYLNVSRYNTPLFPLNAISEFFSSALKGDNGRDTDGYEHSFYIDMIHIELDRYVEHFRKHLTDFTFAVEHKAHKSYALTITTKTSLYRLLHAASVLCLFLSMLGNEYIDISDSILEKYIRSLNVIDAPFYIRSLFARNFLSSRQRFNQYREELERTDRYRIRFEFGGTALQRRNYIGSVLPFNKSIVDIGCGEGFYAIPFAGKIEANYYAIDVNEALLETVRRKADAKSIDNIATFPSLDRFLEDYNGERVDVILTEVIEHMPMDEVEPFIRQICEQVHFDRFIVTTPNADFNRYYELGGFRHDDHKWEMGRSEFRQWFQSMVQGLDIRCEFVAIGDGVDGIQTTQGVLLKREGA